MALIEAQVAEADEQIGVIREVLDQHQISEGSLFRNDKPDISTSSSSVESDDYAEPLTSDDSMLWNTGDLMAFTTDSLPQGLKSELVENKWTQCGAGEVSDISSQSVGFNGDLE